MDWGEFALKHGQLIGVSRKHPGTAAILSNLNDSKARVVLFVGECERKMGEFYHAMRAISDEQAIQSIDIPSCEILELYEPAHTGPGGVLGRKNSPDLAKGIKYADIYRECCAGPTRGAGLQGLIKKSVGMLLDVFEEYG